MTKEDVEKIAEILTHADGGCPYCVQSLYQLFDKAFPAWGEVLDAVYQREMESSWREAPR